MQCRVVSCRVASHLEDRVDDRDERVSGAQLLDAEHVETPHVERVLEQLVELLLVLDLQATPLGARATLRRRRRPAVLPDAAAAASSARVVERRSGGAGAARVGLRAAHEADARDRVERAVLTARNLAHCVRQLPTARRCAAREASGSGCGTCTRTRSDG